MFHLDDFHSKISQDEIGERGGYESLFTILQKNVKENKNGSFNF